MKIEPKDTSPQHTRAIDGPKRKAKVKLTSKSTASVNERDGFNIGQTKPKKPTAAAIRKLEEKLKATSFSRRIQSVKSVFNHPDIRFITKNGRLASGSNKKYMAGNDAQCHWNVAELYSQGKIDAVVIGYAKHPLNQRMGGVLEQIWHQHTWGIKNGKIIETTKSNMASTEYFGAELNAKEAQAFVSHANKVRPGECKMRYVE